MTPPTDESEKRSKDGCPFCGRYAAMEYETCGYLPVMRFEPLGPVVPGHMLFVPIKHVEDAATYPGLSGIVFKAAATWGRDQGGDFNLITSAGASATQTVRHLHVHYVPRAEADGLHLPWTGQARSGVSR